MRIIYEIIKKDQSTYLLTITRKKILLIDEIFTEQFKIPLLDLLSTVKEKGIFEVFQGYVTQNFDLQIIIEKKDQLNSFFPLMNSFINYKYYKINDNSDFTDFYENQISKRKVNTSVFKEFLKYLGRQYSECQIKVTITNRNIIELSLKGYLNEYESKIYEIILNDCSDILCELYSKFVEQEKVFQEQCILERSKNNPFEKQSLNIYNLKRVASHQRFTMILSKNPDIGKPNMINLSGIVLINYLFYFYCFRLEYGWELFNFEKGNVFYPDNDSKWFYILTLESELKVISNKYFIELKSCRALHSYRDLLIDINIPIVKKVHFHIEDKIGVPEISFELKNIEDQKSIDEHIEYIPILNEDKIPCLLDVGLFCKYSINNKLLYRKEEIIKEISQNFDILKTITEERIQQDYIDEYLNRQYSESDFTKEFKNVELTNSIILKNFHFNKIHSYFFHQLIHRYQKEILLIKGSHQFVIPNTKEQVNEELGRRTEWLVNRFLKDCIEFDKWFYTIDDGDVEKRKPEYLRYPFKTIPTCKTSWNNQSVESFKPYDFSIEFRNVDYKIEVKSTRGDEENIFYISVNELEELLKGPDCYLILRLSYIEKFEIYHGIQFNDEFYGRFYKMKPETVRYVKRMLQEWKEFNKTKSIRFTVDQFELIPDTFDKNTEPNFSQEPSVFNCRYWDKYEEFVQKKYFDDFERILESYSVFPEVTKLKDELIELKSEEKFHSVENLLDDDFVLPNEVEDITIEKVVYSPNINRNDDSPMYNNKPVEDDLPF